MFIVSRTFAARLRELLDAKDWTPYRLSEASGIPRSGLSAYLAGRAFPEDATIAKIAEKLDAEIDELRTLVKLSQIGPDWEAKVRLYAPEALGEIHDRLIRVFPDLDPNMENYESFKLSADDIGQLLTWDKNSPPLSEYVVMCISGLGQNPHIKPDLAAAIRDILAIEASKTASPDPARVATARAVLQAVPKGKKGLPRGVADPLTEGAEDMRRSAAGRIIADEPFQDKPDHP